MKKSHKIIMLPTDEKMSYLGKFKDTEELVFNDLRTDIPRGEMQHLYILSDDEIKEGDWYIHSGITWNEKESYSNVCYCYSPTRKVEGKEELFVDGMFAKDCKKIIATTDRDLYYPKNSIAIIPKPLIKYYAQHQPEEVELEYYVDGVIPYGCEPEIWNTLNLQDNEVVWVEHSLKDGLKKVIDRIDGMIGDRTKRYTHEEVASIARKAMAFGRTVSQKGEVDKWINDNLK